MKSIPSRCLSIALIFLAAALPLAAQTSNTAEPFEPSPLSPDAPAMPDGPLTTDVRIESDIMPSPTQPAARPEAEQQNPIIPPGQTAADIAPGLTDEEKQRYVTLLREAAELVQGIRIQEALQRLIEAEALYPDFFGLHNVKGAAYTKIRDFEKATASFKKCIELNPDSLEARFNLAEMSFVQKGFASALDEFTTLLENNPRFPAQTKNLIRYKIYLCLLQLDKKEEAEKHLSEFSYMSDTPEYYFANAAKSFHAGDKSDARSWLKSASRIYDRALQELFVDSLVELEYIDTL